MDFNTTSHPNSLKPQIQYRQDLDGLRGFALLLVLIYHAGFNWMSGGFIAIDIFFVLSGFLITNIILNDIDRNRFSLKDFYDRRMRRIAPAFYAIILLTFFPAWFVLVPLDMEAFTASNLSASGFLSNIYFWLDANYFSSEAELKPLLHTWSLAVEFQFYLFFPILIILIKKLIPQYLTTIIFIVFLASLVLCQWASIHSPTANYYFLPTRMWEFFYGTLIALISIKQSFHRFNKKLSNIAIECFCLCGLLLLTLPLFLYQKQFPYPSVYTLAPTTGSALLILFCDKSIYLSKFFKTKVFVFSGLISYSAYLIHQPLYVFSRQLGYSTQETIIGTSLILLTLALAVISWKYIETPLRNKKIVANKPFYSIISALILINIAASLASQKTNGFAFRYHLPAALENKFELAQLENGWCFYSIDSNRSLTVGEEGTKCHIGKTQKNSMKGLLFGDSTTGSFEPFWNELGQKLDAKINVISTNWCYPSSSQNYLWTKDTPAYQQCLYNREYLTEKIQEYDFIILSSVWSKLVQDHVYQETLSLIEELTDQKNKRVIIMAQTPIIDRFAILRTIYQNKPLDFEERDELAVSLNDELSRMADNNKNVYFISRDQMFGENTKGQLVTKDQLPYSLDGIHLSIYGSLKAVEVFIQQNQLEPLKEFLDTKNSEEL